MEAAASLRSLHEELVHLLLSTAADLSADLDAFRTALDAARWSPALPERSALNIAAELSERIPEKLDVHITETKITPDRAMVAGETNTFDAVDQMVTAYSKDPCYTNIKKGKLRRLPSGNRIEFVLSMRLECS